MLQIVSDFVYKYQSNAKSNLFFPRVPMKAFETCSHIYQIHVDGKYAFEKWWRHVSRSTR